MDKLPLQPKTVMQAKQQLLIAASNVDYFEPIKRHPIRSLIMAFSAGFLINGKDSKAKILLPSLPKLLMTTIAKL